MIRVLFNHQNLPGQFRRLIRYLQTRPDHELTAIGEEAAVRREFLGPRLRVLAYPKPDGAGAATHHYLTHCEACIRRGLAAARLVLPDGRELTRAQPVLTCVARKLEPYRGFHVFMRSLPRLLAGNPDLQVVVIGGDGVSYGRRPPAGHDNYRSALRAELDARGEQVDWSRVHFLGKVPHAVFRSALQVASLHVYLTYPFVLSWSMLEAMALGTPVLASDTAPVREVIRDGENGSLVPFFDTAALADRALDLVARREETAAAGMAGRATVLRRYDFETVGLPGYLALIEPLPAHLEAA